MIRLIAMLLVAASVSGCQRPAADPQPAVAVVASASDESLAVLREIRDELRRQQQLTEALRMQVAELEAEAEYTGGLIESAVLRQTAALYTIATAAPDAPRAEVFMQNIEFLEKSALNARDGDVENLKSIVDQKFKSLDSARKGATWLPGEQ